MRISSLLLLALLQAGTALAAEPPAVTISDAWIRETPPGVTPMAGYAEISNQGSETVVLVKVTSDTFGRIELHRTRIEGEVARMERKNNLTLSSGQTVKLQPGDYHLMLFEPTRPLKAGDKVKLTFLFKDRPAHEVDAEVRTHDSSSAGHKHHHNH